MCEEKSEQGHGRHCTGEWPQELPWAPKNRPSQSAVEAVVPEVRPQIPVTKEQAAAAQITQRSISKDCFSALGAAFANQVLSLQTLVQVLDGFLKGLRAASSGEQTLCFSERFSSLSFRTISGLTKVLVRLAMT